MSEAEPGSTEVLAYGDESPLQVGALTLPADAPTAEDLEGSAFEGLPVVVLVHGGFWRPGYDRSLMDPLAASVAAQGWAAWASPSQWATVDVSLYMSVCPRRLPCPESGLGLCKSHRSPIGLRSDSEHMC